MPIPVLLQGQGLTAITPAACGALEGGGRGLRRLPPLRRSCGQSPHDLYGRHRRRRLGIVDDPAFHAAGHRDHLARDVAGEFIGREHQDLASDVFWSGHLPQGHRSRDPVDTILVETCAGSIRTAPGPNVGRPLTTSTVWS